MRLRPARLGDSGEDVRWAQMALSVAPATGMFDERTWARVKGFQVAHSIPVSGMLDNETVEALQRWASQ